MWLPRRPRKPGRQPRVRISSERIALRHHGRCATRPRSREARHVWARANLILVAASLSSIPTLFFLCRIAKNVHKARTNQERKLSILFDAPGIILAHTQLFPNHESIL